MQWQPGTWGACSAWVESVGIHSSGNSRNCQHRTVYCCAWFSCTGIHGALPSHPRLSVVMQTGFEAGGCC